MTGFRRQLSLLGTAPGFRLLFLATLGSSLGTLLATVALVVDIKDRTNSGSWVSALMIIEFLPAMPTGMKREAFMAELERRIESATGKLLLECGWSPATAQPALAQAIKFTNSDRVLAYALTLERSVNFGYTVRLTGNGRK